MNHEREMERGWKKAERGEGKSLGMLREGLKNAEERLTPRKMW